MLIFSINLFKSVLRVVYTRFYAIAMLFYLLRFNNHLSAKFV